MSLSTKKLIQDLLSPADIQINGSRPWDIQVHDERTFARTLGFGSLGFGEAYMDGWWDCEAIDQMLTRVFESNIDRHLVNWRVGLFILKSRLFNAQRRSKAFEVGERHYDVGNDLYQAMLDKRLTYTCGYWKQATTLDEAQEAKLDLVCRKIGLEKGMRVLDIGCGWGSFAKFAAEKYGAEVLGITVSKQQIEFGRENTKGLPIELRFQDYREVTGSFDRVVSLGMFEHVGYKNYQTYMNVIHRLLSKEGIFLLHTIGCNRSVKSTDPWIDKYIFPNSMLPSVAQIGASIERRFVMEDWHNFGTDYDKTLLAWYEHFEKKWSEIKHAYDNHFYRMWRFYLLSCAATFRTRRNQLWQIVLSKDGIKNGYQSIR
ncbi:MAG: Cyclopropane-fatty-acyl-phospholipid synthase [Candidatus Uhrbacteria bacterium GW2011_GWF2_39_13]|uniref:Cyclopropane-fatty-acyl-phospholipid synthase n=1 Tax=Candidatus Uhrbacteria bacterium GW2011_GWF2_39_13 TaxID=1618995 RepID=A0A0G0QQX2_9BACT|nr:MAG: Cyclopropane-fatty-acyl-phospholipid synthase [Candidatus Uhrbacteria bacterium GW2011_GWF2_39_13]HAU66213.1 cyclopropane fatty acyl phospholipid synthase [Candidatus Uhrbacteria bacterium]